MIEYSNDLKPVVLFVKKCCTFWSTVTKRKKGVDVGRRASFTKRPDKQFGIFVRVRRFRSSL